VAVAKLTDVILTNNRAFVESLSYQERAFGDSSHGPYVWKLEDVRRLEEPIAVAGQQGLWNWEVPAALHSILSIQAAHIELETVKYGYMP
jgi:hypothetical protein